MRAMSKRRPETAAGPRRVEPGRRHDHGQAAAATGAAEVLAEWWTPFGDFLAHERRYSAYTVRNYRQAFEDF
jgi:hypothetical protein